MCWPAIFLGPVGMVVPVVEIENETHTHTHTHKLGKENPNETGTPSAGVLCFVSGCFFWAETTTRLET